MEETGGPRQNRASGGISEGVRTGIGILSAVKDALEETFGEILEGSDLSSDRARELVRDAGQRLQSSLEEARERFDFVPREEMEQLRRELAELRRRVDLLERRGGGPEGSGPPRLGTDEIPDVGA
jgi:polyhydroxyalkanoate synthesis regulator phasin